MMQSNQNLLEINKILLKMKTRMMMVKWKQPMKQMLSMLQEVVNTRKEKLPRTKLKEAMADYHGTRGWMNSGTG